MSSDAVRRSQAAPAATHLPLSLRLKAWWHGYDLRAIRRQMELQAKQHGVSYEHELQPWERGLLKVQQMIWGEGFLGPGGAERAAELVKPLGLDESMSVLEIGCGLGGQARLIAREHGSWVTGIEADRELADVARLMSEKAGFGKKAQVHAFDPEHVEFRQRSFDVAISTDALYRIADKERLLHAISEALKGRAQILLVDFLRNEEATDETALKAWMETEPAPPELWTERDYRKCLNDLKFDVRVCHDVSQEMRSTIVGGFTHYLNGAAQAGVDPALQELLVAEVERWTRTVAALDSGALRAVRLYGQRAQREALLSDW
jgi:2-polyprenyl-3-methyl-5-hydroxy-6-metoxy-1,4-benzoquinol methylase